MSWALFHIGVVVMGIGIEHQFGFMSAPCLPLLPPPPSSASALHSWFSKNLPLQGVNM